MHRILARQPLAPDVVRIWIDAPVVARKRRPGQFVIVRLSEEGERIPLTIAEVDEARGAIALIVQGVGKSTKTLNRMQEGDGILDVAGPLGQPTNVGANRTVCCIAGGIGAAVILPIARAFKAAGGYVTVIVGARTRALVILEDEFRAIADQTIVTTDDGSHGVPGLVTDALHDVLACAPAPFDEVVAAGPLPMMRAVCDVTRPPGIRTTVSLNPIMIDGTGMCGGCRVSIGGQQKFVCVDGPEFDGHQVDFAELIARLSAFREFERIALHRAGL